MTAQAGGNDPLTRSLDGDLIIEASAGTGKTYTLTTLVARLIVEAERSIDELLIVTFTISAAGELRDRVWRTLQAARRTLAEPDAPVDDQARELARRWRSVDIRGADAAKRLTSAIRDFDRANITTIHGFCQRALSEFALHAGIPFRFQVSGDDALAVAAATQDFWRQNMAPADIPFLEYAEGQNFVPKKGLPWGEDATTWVVRCHAKQSDIRGAADPEEVQQAQQSGRDPWRQAFQAARAAWNDASQRQIFLEALATHRWNKNENDDRLNEVTAAFRANDPALLAREHAGYFGRESLTGKLRKTTPRQQLPAILLYDAFDRLGKAATELPQLWLAGQRSLLLENVRTTLHHDAWAGRRLSFNALLTELHRALDGQFGSPLAERIRARYPVALIDEFQDTDRLQADIFEKIYPGGGAANGSLLVVGDPKQSIYRFRGADVFAYFDAKKRLSGTNLELKLEKNYRSTPGLVRAVNALFERPMPFVLPDPGFHFEAAAAAGSNRGELVVPDQDHDARPFEIQLVRRADGKKWTKGQLRPATAEHTAGEIARLLEATRNGGAAAIVSEAGKAPITDGDIAVLVRTGEQGRAVAQALLGYGIDSIEMGVDNVFDSHEAAALYRLLYALCTAESEYNATPLLRGALAADLFGLNLQDLASLRDEDDFWTDWRDQARGSRGWGQVWKEQGIAALIRYILFAKESDCAANLLGYPDGPRRLTNYLHLADLLHEAETRRRPSRHGLVDWFRRSRAEPSGGDETSQLRLESDESLVKIVTVHRAKGLEFPIVFCPFTWDGRQPKPPEIAEYFDAAEGTPVLHLRPSDDNRDRQRLEEHADELRLLYVALTRAKYRCVVGWAQATGAQHAPLAWLLHPNGGDSGGDQSPIDALKENAERVAKLGAEEWRADVHRLAGKALDAISVREIDLALPDTGEPLRGAEPEASDKPLQARQLRRQLASIRQRTSYSALSTSTGAAQSEIEHEEAERPDHDPDEREALTEIAAAERPADEDELTVFTFPSGNRPGKCLHQIFEKRLQPDHDLVSICRDALARYGIDSKWAPVVRTLIQDTLDTPLTQPGEAGSVFRVADLERPIPEMEFHLPVQGLQQAELAERLREHGYGHSLPHNQTAINGFLHGYIDVVAQNDHLWYVLDYKSNWLGPDLSAYSPEGLGGAMRQHGYHLQYLLYLTALHRLLRLRLPGYDYDRHIGGAFYLFVRGMRPNTPGSGVFHNRPSRTCIEAIDACLGDAP